MMSGAKGARLEALRRLALVLISCLPWILAPAAATSGVSIPSRSTSTGQQYISVSLVSETRTNPVTATLDPLGKTPLEMAVLIDSDDFSRAQWTDFKRRVSVVFPTEEGPHKVAFGFKWSAQEIQWDINRIKVDRTPPVVVITNPRQSILSQPMIQLRGTSTEKLSSVYFDLLNAAGTTVVRQEQGSANDSTEGGLFAPNTFSCYDIGLTPGTNTVVLHCTDYAGNTLTTNLAFVFTTAGDTNPPVLTVLFPRDESRLYGSEFTLRGVLDDPTARIIALVSSSTAETREINGLVARDGNAWIERIPISDGTSDITVVAMDAAGNSSVTNITVKKSLDKFVIDPVPRSDFHKRTVTVTGFFSRANHTIWVNGVKATMDETGRWIAEQVPVTEGGSAEFDAVAIPNERRETLDESTNSTPKIHWGETTNSLRVGIALPNSDTNKFNPHRCQLYVMNISGTNLGRNWIRPKEPYRYQVRLFEKGGKEVPRNVFGKMPEQTLPDYLNLHRLQRKDLDFIDGVFTCPANREVCLGSFSLLERFRVESPGVYRLEAVERLFRIKDDGHLTPVFLAPISTEVTVVDQPGAMAFLLADMHHAGKLRWGKPQRDLQVGLAYEHNSRNKLIDRIDVFLMNQGTNQVRDIWLPKPGERFGVSLYDAAGKEVRRTALGKNHGQPLSWQEKPGPGGSGGRRSLKPVFVYSRDAAHCLSFDLHDLFEIKQPGHYRLTYQQRLYRRAQTGAIEELHLPMVIMPIEILITPGE